MLGNKGHYSKYEGQNSTLNAPETVFIVLLIEYVT
jgi:hypothetical protein